MSLRGLEALFRPRSVTLVGADKRPGSVGSVVAHNLFNAGFDGPILPVHRSERSLQGVLTYASVDRLPLTPDLAVIASPAAEVPDLIDQLGRRGTRAAIVFATDFVADAAAGGGVPEAALRAAARRHGVRVVGPACLGVLVPSHGLNASYAATPARASDLAFVTESGSVLDAMLGWAAASGVGFALAASLGDMIDVDVGDVLDYLAFDASCRAVLLYIERMSSPRKFLSAARALARMKPVIVYRPAAIGEAPLADVAGAPLLEGDAVFDAAFKRAGLLPVSQLSDLIAAAQTLTTRTRIAGERLAVIANGRGLGTAVADTIRAHRGVLASLAPATVARLDEALPAGWGGRNPVNVFADAGADRYRAAIDALLADDGSDVIIATLGPTAVGDRNGAAEAVAKRLGGAGKPGVAILFGDGAASARPLFAAEAVPVFDSAAAAVSSIQQLVNFRRNQDMLMQAPPSTPELFTSDLVAARRIVEAALAAGRSELDDGETAALLAAYGVPLGERGERKRGDDEAPVQWLRITAAMDAAFGPVIVFGPGRLPPGVEVDRAVALPPLNLALAQMAMAETSIDRVLAGFGEAFAPAREELALILVKVSHLLTDLPEIAALDIDPLRADAEGIRALRCRIRLASVEPGAEARLAIRPYPRELEKRLTTQQGRTLLLRPIRPEDAPALQAFVRSLDPKDIRLRFLAPIKELDHRFAARLTQIDYDREMAFVAVDPAGDGGLLGVVRIAADADNRAAEYAIAIRSDFKGQGLGRLLMEEIIAYARRRGIGEIWGTVLAENAPMLALVRKLGFTVSADADDRSLVRVALRLGDDQPASSAP